MQPLTWSLRARRPVMPSSKVSNQGSATYNVQGCPEHQAALIAKTSCRHKNTAGNWLGLYKVSSAVSH